jgi:hypothetical protein
MGRFKQLYKSKNIKYLVLHLGLIILFTSFIINAQGQAAHTLGNSPGKGVEFNPQPQGVISELPLSEPKTVGTSYIYETWHLGNIDLGERGMIRNKFIRYDLSNHFIEIKLDSVIKAVDGIYVKNFNLIDIDGISHRYVNCSEFVYDNTRLLGFFEIIDEGEYSLFLRTEAILIESDYVMQLDMGSRDHKIVKEEEFFIAHDTRVIKVPRSRNNLEVLYPEVEGLKTFLKSEKVNTKKEKDLKKLVDFLNHQET